MRNKEVVLCLVQINTHTYYYISNICVSILFVCLRLYVSFEGSALIISLFFNYKYNFPWGQYLVDIESFPFLLNC